MDCRNSKVLGKPLRQAGLATGGSAGDDDEQRFFLGFVIVHSQAVKSPAKTKIARCAGRFLRLRRWESSSDAFRAVVRLDRLDRSRADLVVAIEGRDLIALSEGGIVEHRVDEVV